MWYDKYCDITPASLDPLLGNGSLKQVSAAADKHRLTEELWDEVIWIRLFRSYKTGGGGGT
jgi:hypothetical protein